jgi:hypothetical protein
MKELTYLLHELEYNWSSENTIKVKDLALIIKRAIQKVKEDNEYHQNVLDNIDDLETF